MNQQKLSNMPVAGILLRNPANNTFLLMHHTKSMKYGIPTGRIEEGESPIDAMLREVKEELGITLYELNLEFVKEVFPPSNLHPGELFSLKLFHTVATDDVLAAITNAEPDVCSELRWCSVVEIKDLVETYQVRVSTSAAYNNGLFWMTSDSCKTCFGWGHPYDSCPECGHSKCPRCNGYGYEYDLGNTTKDCDQCHGSATIIK